LRIKENDMAKLKDLKKRQHALFYQESPKNGYWTTFVDYIKDDSNKHEYRYKTKIGAFKNVKLCTLQQALQIMGLNKIRK
jgi:hypothetical protein